MGVPHLRQLQIGISTSKSVDEDMWTLVSIHIVIVKKFYISKDTLYVLSYSLSYKGCFYNYTDSSHIWLITKKRFDSY